MQERKVSLEEKRGYVGVFGAPFVPLSNTSPKYSYVTISKFDTVGVG
jgi:hypothetical protein